MKAMTCKEALQLLLDQVDFTAGACSLTDMVGQCVPEGVFEKCREAIAAETSRPEAQRNEADVWLDGACMGTGYTRWWIHSGRLHLEREGEPGRIEVMLVEPRLTAPSPLERKCPHGYKREYCGLCNTEESLPQSKP